MFSMFSTTPPAQPTTMTTSCKFLHDAEKSNNFGIFSISVEQTTPKITQIDWILNVDRSGSMNDRCPDGKTKMEHIHHTLKNMVDYFLKLSTTLHQTLTIIGFDHEVENICEKMLIDANLKTNFVEILEKLTPRGATNIGAALTAVSKLMDAAPAAPNAAQNPHTMHIFMSDGQITTGERNKTALADIIMNTKCKHAFIGFGVHHDDVILSHLADATQGEYYFIDSLENAGMVYGEILYVGLYEYIQNLNVEMENGEFYNYNTNKWTKTLMVDSISSGQTRTWHVRSVNSSHDDTPDVKDTVDNGSGQAPDGSAAHVAHPHAHMAINGTYNIIDDATTTHTLPPTDIEFPAPGAVDKEVEKYHWRQRTQELMHDVKQFIAESAPPPPQQGYQSRYVVNALYPGAQPAPPQDKYLNEAHLILDSAKRGVWSVVWSMLDKNPSLINTLPYPRKFCLIHQAVYQQNEIALQTLLNRGASISTLTSEGNNVNQIDPAHHRKKEVQHIINNAYQAEKIKNIAPEDMRKIYGNRLDEFLKELKTYMSENDLEDNAFMQTLCDDIYITIRSLTSKYGSMYLRTRSTSQGRERAYNITNITTLESDTTASYRSLGGQHGVSQSNTTSYASPQAEALMRQVSS